MSDSYIENATRRQVAEHGGYLEDGYTVAGGGNAEGDDLLAEADDGDTFDVVYFQGSKAGLPGAGYTTTYPMFVHTFADTGETCLLVEQWWLDQADEGERERARAYADGVALDSVALIAVRPTKPVDP